MADAGGAPPAGRPRGVRLPRADRREGRRRRRRSCCNGARSGAAIVPGAHVLYCPSEAELVPFARALGLYCARHGRLFVVVDAAGPVAGLVGKFFPGREPRYFKGPRKPPPCDLAYTELAILGRRSGPSRPRDRMEEAAADAAAPRARRLRRAAVGVAHPAKGGSPPSETIGRVMEFVAAKACAGGAQRAVGGERRVAIAERHLALGEAGFDAQQPGHRDGSRRRRRSARRRAPCSRRTRRAPAASARSRAGRRESARAPASLPGVQFGIAAGQPADVAVRPAAARRRAARRSANSAPAARQPDMQMRIEERERRVARERDALARRRDGGGGARRASTLSGRASASIAARSTWAATASAIASRRGSSASNSPACTRPRWRSGSAQRLEARDRADDLHAERLDRLAREAAMARAADAVEHDAGDVDARIVSSCSP